jgi:hypothetical protein
MDIWRLTTTADGTVVISTIINTRSSLNDEPCTYRLIARLVD